MKLRRMKLRHTKSMPVFLGHPVWRDCHRAVGFWLVGWMESMLSVFIVYKATCVGQSVDESALN